MKHLTIAALVAAAPVAATADTLSLSSAMAGGTLHAETVDMSVYWTRSDSAMEVVATYLPNTGDAAPQRLRMRLEEGDSTSFGLPGHPGSLFTFARTGGTLDVSEGHGAVRQALN